MTYIESALWDFTKSIMTRGVRTLFSSRFFPYSLVLIIIVLMSTTASFLNQLLPDFNISSNMIDILLYVEIASAIAFLAVGLVLGRFSAKVQLPSILGIIIVFTYIFYYQFVPENIIIYLAAIFYILWIGIITFSTFSLFRDLFGNDLFGTILFLGKKEDDGDPLFTVLGMIFAVMNFGLGYMLLSRAGDSLPILFTSLVIMFLAIIAIIPLIGIQKKNDVFYTIMNAFYMFTTIRVILLVFRVLTDAAGTAGDNSIWDTIFSMFMALYAVQGAAVKGIKIGKKSSDLTVEEQVLEETEDLGFSTIIAKILTDRGIVLSILGVLLGYHAMQIQTSFGKGNLFDTSEIFSGSDIVILGYQVNIIISMLIFIVSFILFAIFPKYRKYANPEVNRIPWAPQYDDLKAMLAGIKSGDVSWKADTAKLAVGLATDKLKSKFGMKSKSGNRIAGTFNKWLGKSGKRDED